MTKNSFADGTVRALDFEGALVLVDTEQQRLLVYNESANFIWHRAAAGACPAAIAAELAAHAHLDPARALEDVRAMFDHWQRELTSAPPVANDTIDRGPVDWRSRPEPGWSLQRTFGIGSATIRLRVEQNSGPVVVGSVFRHFPEAAGPATLDLQVRSTGPYEGVVLADGIERIHTWDPGLLIGALHQAILEHLHPKAAWLAHLHSGSVARSGGGVIALPAPSGSGKTTLTAHLVRRGYAYFSDDLTAITAEGAVVPWPMPLSIKQGSWTALAASYGDLEKLPPYRTKGFEARLVAPPDAAWTQAPQPLKAIVFPQFDASARTALRPTSPLDALQRLLSDRAWFGYPLEEVRVQRFLTLLSATPVFALTFRDLESATAALAESGL